jgi:hypothetical protein
MNSLKRLVLAVFTLLFCVSCAHYPMKSGYTGPKNVPADILGRYSYKDQAVEYTEKLIEEKERYFVKRIVVPAINVVGSGATGNINEEFITIDYYQLKTTGKSPIIIVLPILGGDNWEAKFFSKYFAENGYSAMIVHRDQKQRDKVDLATLEPSLRQMIVDHRRAIDWIGTRPELDQERIGVFGVSMGGIKAALVTALDHRVKASVIALAGGDLPHILINSKEKAVIEKINKIMTERDIDKQELYKILKETVKTDPIIFAQFIDARKVLMILAALDKVVPYENGKELAEKIGSPEQIHLLAGHYTSILYIFYVRSASLDFFERKFK